MVQSFAQTENQRVGGWGPDFWDPSVPRPTPAQQAEINEAFKLNFFNGHVFRKVNGKIYNGLSWGIISGEVDQKENGILILKNEVYSSVPFVNEWRLTTTYAAIKNYSGSALADQHVKTVAMPVGTYDMGGSPIALFDCGTLPTPEQLRQIKDEEAKAQALIEKQKAEAQKAAQAKIYAAQARTIIWLQSQATNGDAGAQCNLGEHYLNGQGCETNREQAIYWLQKAAAQGDIEASNKLANLQK